MGKGQIHYIEVESGSEEEDEVLGSRKTMIQRMKPHMS
jgi:hypothetical protein